MKKNTVFSECLLPHDTPIARGIPVRLVKFILLWGEMIRPMILQQHKKQCLWSSEATKTTSARASSGSFQVQMGENYYNVENKSVCILLECGNIWDEHSQKLSFSFHDEFIHSSQRVLCRLHALNASETFLPFFSLFKNFISEDKILQAADQRFEKPGWKNEGKTLADKNHNDMKAAYITDHHQHISMKIQGKRITAPFLLRLLTI